VIKLGVVMVAIALAFVWTEYAVGSSWSWIRQLGTTSLLVYWVHIELVYGRWFGLAHTNLSNIECAFWAAVLIALMVGISVTRTRWSVIKPAILQYFTTFSSSPRRVSGD